MEHEFEIDGARLLKRHARNPAGGVWIVHDGVRQVAEISLTGGDARLNKRKRLQAAKDYAMLFTAAPVMLAAIQNAYDLAENLSLSNKLADWEIDSLEKLWRELGAVLDIATRDTATEPEPL